jgi:hypothetical protein
MTDTLRDRLGALVRELQAEGKKLVDRSESLANSGEAHRSDLSLARGRELEGAAAKIASALAAQPAPAVMGEGAIRRLISECKAVLAFEHELREISVLGNTNVNAFKLRVEEAELALAAQPAVMGEARHVGWIAGHCSDPMNCPVCKAEGDMPTYNDLRFL